MDDNNPVHLHFTPSVGTNMTITTNPDGSVNILTTAIGEAGAASASVDFPPDVEDMIRRHETNGFKGTRSRELATVLADRGWVVKAGPKYLRYIYAGSKNKITLYANSRDIMSREYRDTLDTWPNAIPEKNETRWRYNEADYQAALETIDQLEAFADGKESVA